MEERKGERGRSDGRGVLDLPFIIIIIIIIINKAAV